VSQSGTTGNKYQYAGEQLDGTLGDYYLRQRFYDTSSGRFGRMDTYQGNLQSPITSHKYIYANLNPTLFIDPSGYFGIMDALSIVAIVGILAALAAIDSTPLNHGSDGGRGFTSGEARNIEMAILNESNRLAMNDSEGGTISFAQLMQYAAGAINPTYWLNNRKIRSQYLQIASDMFTPSFNKGKPYNYNKFPFLGESGPRSLGRPVWLQEHVESSNWKVFVIPDVEDNTDPTRRITGRRSHFIANANLGPIAGAYADTKLSESSENDRIVNGIGRSFGMNIANGSISQLSIFSWINSAL
jgi:RHS repeat-associated protein